ncbi:MAG: hypothetical protein WC140_02965 [Bacteroidales bacterium]
MSKNILNNIIRFFLSLTAIVIILSSFSVQNISAKNNILQKTIEKDTLKVMFWNVENYFDIYDDPNIIDEEFLPTSDKHWNSNRYNKKRDDIAKTIIAASGKLGEMPILIGVSEIENYKVLNDLIKKTSLSKYDYKIVHKDSPDHRGIDCALLYRESAFKVKSAEYLKVVLQDKNHPTRDIVHVYGYSKDLKIKVHVYVNHWPSKWGGAEKTNPNRIAAAKVLANSIKNVRAQEPDAKIIIMGDLNDTPGSEPIMCLMQDKTLVDLISPLDAKGMGTIRYRGDWECLDHFIINKNELKGDIQIYSPKFLIQYDKKYRENKPFRTYYGPHYNKGISDHFPILLKVVLK